MLLRTSSSALPLFREVGFVTVCSSGLRRFCRIHITRRGTITSKNGDRSVAISRTRTLVQRVASAIGHRLRSHIHVCRRGVLPTLQHGRIIFCRDGDRIRSFRGRFMRHFFVRRIFPCVRPIGVSPRGMHFFLQSEHLCLTMGM